MDEAEAFPLCWPAGWPRAKRQSRSRYQVTYDKALREMLREVRLLGGSRVVVSSNVPVRRDGLPYADWAKRKIDDPGVAVYFLRSSEQQVVACDTWDQVRDNIRAIGLTVSALRQIDRSGASELLNRAFAGFKALPPAGGTTTSTGPDWRSVLGVDPFETELGKVRAAYRNLSREHHPDRGGDAGAMAIINRAWEQAQAELAG